MKRSIIFHLILFLFSCNNSPYKEYLNNPDYGLDRAYSYTLKLVDSLDIVSPDSIGIQFSYTSIYKDTMFYGATFNSELIHVFNLKKQKYSYSIKVPPHLLTDNIWNINVISSDSIYFLSNRAYQLYLINNKGKVLKKSKIPNVHININMAQWQQKVDTTDLGEDDLFFGFPLFTNEKNPEIINDTIALIGFYLLGSDNMKGFENAERFGLFNLKTEKWIRVFAPPKGIMSHLGEKNYRYDLTNPNYCVVDNKLFISYPMDNYIYVYDIYTGKYISKKIASSVYCERMPGPQSNSVLANPQKSWNFRITTPFYKQFYYHPKIKMFTRVFFHEQNLFQEDGKLNEGKKRMASIIIMDENLNIVGEKVFHNASLGSNATALNDGLLINRSPNYWASENQFVHKYIYKIIKQK